MAAQPAANEPDVGTFEATVAAVDGSEVVLDRTYFYAESGGQPADRGTLAGVPVVDVQFVEGDAVHFLAESPAIGIGDRVEGRIDPTHRAYCRRAHSASHVLYGVARDLLADLGYGGFDIGERKVRIDFRTTSDVGDRTLVELARRATLVVWESRPVTWEEVSIEEARRREGVAFNAKTEEGVFGEGAGVRLVEIGAPTVGEDADGWLDRAACGGTHVRNTREIGPIAVVGRSNPGEGLVRVELAVGPAAVEHASAISRVAHETAEVLGIGIPEVPDRVRQLQADVEGLTAELRDAREELAAGALDAISPVERDGAEWIVGTLDGADADVAADQARAVVGDAGDVIALVTGEGPVRLSVASAGPVSANAVIDEVTDAFGGGGGGGDDFAQGGGIDADPEAVVELLRT